MRECRKKRSMTTTIKASPENIRKKLPTMRIRLPRHSVTATRKRKWRWMSMFGPLL